MILDTNVVSELIKPSPDPAVLAWFRAFDVADLAVSAVTLMETRHGVDRLPKSRRQAELSELFHGFFTQAVAEIMPFDVIAAEQAGTYLAQRERIGRPLNDARDAMIAGTVLSAAERGSQAAILATRNVNDFVLLDVVNPWEA